ncbi:MAG: acetyl-CoA carboxylase biotin carboxyl carrier protein [Acidobacteria bacterium]|nr:acetyl-CoA carboxylase biotin carboxyl carrier protein [Acidobacteriota bacterium]
MDELRELAEMVNEHGFTDFEFENENIRVRLSKTPPASAVQYIPQPQPVAYAAPPGQGIAQPQAQAAPAADGSAASVPAASAEEELHQITSPIVGTFYRSSGPDKEPYVKEGVQVAPSTIVCIVEAMKLMNEIEAEVTGEVVKIYVENGQPVEYGQPLFGIRK